MPHMNPFAPSFFSEDIYSGNSRYSAILILPFYQPRRHLGHDLLAVMAFVAHSGTFGTAAERPEQATCPTLEDVLIDMLCPRPGETAGVVTAQHVKWRVVGCGVSWVDHRHQQFIVSVPSIVVCNLLGCVHND